MGVGVHSYECRMVHVSAVALHSSWPHGCVNLKFRTALGPTSNAILLVQELKLSSRIRVLLCRIDVDEILERFLDYSVRNLEISISGSASSPAVGCWLEVQF